MTTATIARGLLVPAVAASLTAAAVLLTPSGAADARAANTTVTVAGMAFSPARVTVAVGQKVTWAFQDSVAHTTTSDQGFWDSGTRSSGAAYARTFTSAGTFAYHCSLHPHMRGKVRVPVTATGSPGEGWTVRWSTKRGKGAITFDVQTRRGAGKWVSLRAGTARAAARFDPARAGSYQLRARTLRGAERSGWSPAVTVPIS